MTDDPKNSQEVDNEPLSSIDSLSVEERPWGFYIVLERGKRYKIKRVTVSPGHQLSLQLHYYRSEHWIVVSGFAEVELDGVTLHVKNGESVFVPMAVKHRLKNPGVIPLEVIEVQIGEYLKENDIIRFEDEYDRDCFTMQQQTPSGE